MSKINDILLDAFAVVRVISVRQGCLNPDRNLNPTKLKLRIPLIGESVLHFYSDRKSIGDEQNHGCREFNKNN